MTDLILLDPPADVSLRLGKLANAGSHLPSLGLGYLASVARRKKCSVKIIDANVTFNTLKDLVEGIYSENPKWLGITATTLTIDVAAHIAKKIKAKIPKLMVIVGGAHMTAVSGEVFKRLKDIDIGVIGEGEETFAEILTALKAGKDLKKVKGIIYRKNGKVIVNPRREFLKALDKLPYPAWDLISGFPNKYSPAVNSYMQLPAVHLFTSRGCSGRCLFCDRSVFGRYPRMHSAKYVLAEIEYLVKKYKIREIQFFDDNLLLFPKRLKEICQGMIKKKWGITWSCQARCDMISPKMLFLMKRAGCWQIGLGIESGSNRILENLQKGETTIILNRAIEACHKAGIEAKGYFILGNPGETKETLEETKKFILTTPLTYVYTTFFTPLPGSEAYQRADKFGTFKFRNDWKRLGRGTINAVFVPYGLTKNYLEKEAAEIFKSFYLRPKTISYFVRKSLFTPTLWSAYVKGFLSVLSFSK
jgi:anaerobic magnesium-protoporphyrin IX monomethyl ester cyclase